MVGFCWNHPVHMNTGAKEQILFINKMSFIKIMEFFVVLQMIKTQIFCAQLISIYCKINYITCFMLPTPFDNRIALLKLLGTLVYCVHDTKNLLKKLMAYLKKKTCLTMPSLLD